MKLLIGLILSLLVTAASAQQMSPEQQTASTLGQQIGLIVLKNATDVAALQRQIADLTNEIARLKKECPTGDTNR